MYELDIYYNCYFLKNEMEKIKQPIITKRMLIHDLKELGIHKDQTLMLHVSLKATGWIKNGPETVIQSLLDILGPKGTLMMYVSWNEAPDEK